MTKEEKQKYEVKIKERRIKKSNNRINRLEKLLKQIKERKVIIENNIENELDTSYMKDDQ